MQDHEPEADAEPSAGEREGDADIQPADVHGQDGLLETGGGQFKEDIEENIKEN